MTDFVPEEAIDYSEVYRRGGKNLGDEDFALFKCPRCCFVYLLEYEVDTVYLDGKNLDARQDVTDVQAAFKCVACDSELPREAWAGPKADPKYFVTWEELAHSDWSWIARPATAFGDDVLLT